MARPPQLPVSRSSRIREIAAWSLVAALIALFGWQRFRPQERVDPPVVRVNFDPPPGARINDAITGTTIAVSPKGDMIAFTSISVSGFRMYVRRINEIAARQVSEAAGRNLTFSPDGRWVAFTEGNVLSKVSVDGGQINTVGTTGSAVPYGLSWSESGTTSSTRRSASS